MLFNTALVISGLAAHCSAHMLINIPVPFPSQKTLGNGPLLENGSNFPCKATAGATDTYNGGIATSMALGSEQPISFVGGATHGGGSCQISITYDTSPTKDSTWKVLKSIHNGCPSNDAGNAGEDAAAILPGGFNFTIPTNIPTGKATLAWTWNNKIGNREFYMNCAPIDITASKTRRDDIVARDAQSAFSTLPDMAKVNLPISDCTIAEGSSLLYPDPGTDVQVVPGGTLAPPTGPNCPKKGVAAPASPSSGSSSGLGSGSRANSVELSATVAVLASSGTSDPNSGSASGLPGGVLVTSPPYGSAPTDALAASIISSVDSAAPSSTEVAPISSAAPSAAPSTVESAAPSLSSGGADGSNETDTPCSPEGQWNCLDGTSYQRCASGQWSVVQLLASGTKCAVGMSVDIQISKIKRRVRRYAY
ncbi:hypothetical protein BJ878DRAFT_499174 [Calycina marina]|uniref:Lytic polysaccharide monooxygenase n=1 Tax=Calycina marina TaxID=1763456 RepID=A0A9P7Z6P0_9HELO|nr:hypothetical protein BJ878DRAFT_499174 [Calycina marina]